MEILNSFWIRENLSDRLVRSFAACASSGVIRPENLKSISENIDCSDAIHWRWYSFCTVERLRGKWSEIEKAFETGERELLQVWELLEVLFSCGLINFEIPLCIRTERPSFYLDLHKCREMNACKTFSLIILTNIPLFYQVFFWCG